jgi:hypothetical protein
MQIDLSGTEALGSEVLDGPGDVAVPTSNVNIPEFETLY